MLSPFRPVRKIEFNKPEMNLVDVAITGGAKLTWWILPIMFAAGFMAAVPYNYWRLKAFGKACH